MKTALQQHIQELESMLENEHYEIAKASITNCLICAKSYLETEKEILNTFYKAGEKNVDFDYLHGYGSLSSFEKHFEETFKP